MKNFFALIYIFVISFYAYTTPVSAHTLETDGTFGTVIHINPEDDPIAGEPATLFFEIKDSSQKFSPSDCTCTFTIVNRNSVVYTEKLYETNKNPEQAIQYTFPDRGIYTIQIKGESTKNSFTPFTLSYDLRIERTSESNNQNANNNENWIQALAPILLIPLGALLIIGLVYVFTRRKKIPQAKN